MSDAIAYPLSRCVDALLVWLALIVVLQLAPRVAEKVA